MWKRSDESAVYLTNATERTYTLPLPGDRRIVFTGPFPITAVEWEQVKRMVNAMAPALVKEGEVS